MTSPNTIIADLNADVERLTKLVTELYDQNLRLTRQRDEMLSALEKAVGFDTTETDEPCSTLQT